MMVPDANLLLYAYNASADEHDLARRWWEDALSTEESVGLCWQTITAFLRIGTNSRIFPHPFSMKEASFIVTAWLQQPNVEVIVPTERHWEIFSRLLIESQAAGPLVMDAHLATLAMEHGAILCSHDADFKRFKSLRVHDPFAE